MIILPLALASCRGSSPPGDFSFGEGAIPPREGEWLWWGEDDPSGRIDGWVLLDGTGETLGDGFFALLINLKEERIGFF